MNLSGYVPMRRGILDHTMSGKLTLQEYAALTTLVMLANKSTGAGLINAPVLRTYQPGLSSDAAKRALHGLEEKGYIFRDITPRSPLIYPYWIARYRPTEGRYKALQTDISKALVNRDSKAIRYLRIAPEGALEGALDTPPEGALEGAHYNEKDKETEKEKENPSTSSRRVIGGDVNMSACEAVVSERDAILSPVVSDGESLVNGSDSAVTMLDPSIAKAHGLTLRGGAYFTQAGTEVHPHALQVLSRDSEWRTQ